MAKKYFKTPDVCAVNGDGHGESCIVFGAAVIDTDLLSDMENSLALLIMGKIGMHKCTYPEIRNRDIPHPCGVMSCHAKIVFNCPTSITEVEPGVFMIDNKKIDTRMSAEELTFVLYN